MPLTIWSFTVLAELLDLVTASPYLVTALVTASWITQGYRSRRAETRKRLKAPYFLGSVLSVEY
ncbi:hypothetical protein D3C85_1901830 [compost metagenome]